MHFNLDWPRLALSRKYQSDVLQSEPQTLRSPTIEQLRKSYVSQLNTTVTNCY